MITDEVKLGEKLYDLEADIKVMPIVDTLALKADLQFNPSDLQNAMLSQAALYGHYAMLAAKASLQRDQMETRLDIIKASLGKKVRVALSSSAGKVTEAMVEQEVNRHRTYVAAKSALNEADAIAKLLQSTLKAMEMRRDMLVQLNKNATQEFNYSSALTQPSDPKDAAERALKMLKSL